MSTNDLTSIDYGQYVVQGFGYKSYEFLFDFKIQASENDQLFNGISSYFGKVNIFNLTRQNFLAYLNFYSSYNSDYNYFFEAYKEICIKLSEKIISDVKDSKNIEEVYNNVVQWHYKLVDKIVIEDEPNPIKLSDLYLTFFGNYFYFKKYSIGYSFYFEKEDKKYYANKVGAKYPIKPDTPGLNCVEFDEVHNLTYNFRLYPFIPLTVNPKEPKIQLTIFGNNKWVSPVEFAFPYHNEKKPNYFYSVNSFDVCKTIKDLEKAKISIPIEASVKHYYFNGRLYPASEETFSGKLVLMHQNSDIKDQLMVGVPLFNSGPEWVEKPL